MVIISNIVFTHRYVNKFGWESTIAQPNDYVEVHHWGNNVDGDIFVVTDSTGVDFVLKGYFDGPKAKIFGNTLLAGV